MFHKLVYLCIAFSFLSVKSQRVWGSSNSAHTNPGFSNSWNSNNNGYFSNNNKPSTINNNGGSWGSDFFNSNAKTNERPYGSDQISNWEYETASNSDKIFGWNSKTPEKANNERQSDFNKKSNEKKLSSITNLPSSSQWNSNSNNFPSSLGKDTNSAFSSWAFNSNKPVLEQTSNQNSRPGNKESNYYKKNKPNVNLAELDYEDNSVYSIGSSNNRKKPKPTSNSYGGLGNWDSTDQKNNKNSETPKSDKNKNEKPQKTSESSKWDSKNPQEPGKEISLGSFNVQNEKKPSTLDTSILDELDKNDWYFGKESNFPKPPFRSTLNIDVSELWNFDKGKKFNQNIKGSSSNNRRNRQIERMGKSVNEIQCECVNVNLCEEQDMIITQEDVSFDSRPLAEFSCKKLTDVCCTRPKKKLTSRANTDEDKERLRCGQRRIGENLFENFDDSVAKTGEFPWSLKLEHAEINCSASLIHHKLALTAAHCVTGKQPEEFTLKAGVWNTNNEPPQSRKIINIIPHPDYNSRNPRNDIALLIPVTPFELTDNVNTICLPVTNDKWDSNQCVVAGWRPQEIQGQNFEILEKADVNFLPQAECQNIMLVTDLWRNYILHDSFVCGLEKTGRKPCTEDEGGFVICPSKKQPDTYLQIGIVSKGMNCDNFGRPGIFTNVLKFLDWINKIYFELGLFDDIDIRSFQ